MLIPQGAVELTVTNKVTHALCFGLFDGIENTEKYSKAKELGIPILNEDAFEELCNSKRVKYDVKESSSPSDIAMEDDEKEGQHNSDNPAVNKSSPIYGMMFFFVGRFATPRAELIRTVQSNGATYSVNVSGNVCT